jgi:predicted nucleic acid-binding protein
MRIFLDTSVLSHKSLGELADKLAEQATQGDEFMISVLTHFELLWGYRKANLASSHYENFLEKLGVDVVPLLEEDVMFAADRKPRKEKLVDALIAATVSRYDAIVWTRDRDFHHFLPQEKVTIL